MEIMFDLFDEEKLEEEKSIIKENLMMSFNLLYKFILENKISFENLETKVKKTHLTFLKEIITRIHGTHRKCTRIRILHQI
jgi:hypothetical protein